MLFWHQIWSQHWFPDDTPCCGSSTILTLCLHSFFFSVVDGTSFLVTTMVSRRYSMLRVWSQRKTHCSDKRSNAVSSHIIISSRCTVFISVARWRNASSVMCCGSKWPRDTLLKCHLAQAWSCYCGCSESRGAFTFCSQRFSSKRLLACSVVLLALLLLGQRCAVRVSPTMGHPCRVPPHLVAPHVPYSCSSSTASAACSSSPLASESFTGAWRLQNGQQDGTDFPRVRGDLKMERQLVPLTMVTKTCCGYDAR